MEKRYYLAYGSNLLWQRMMTRCPDAEVVGTAVIPGYRLLFKQSCTGAYATIEQDANCSVPALVYRLNPLDEAALDRFEGYPKYYYKREFLLPVWNPDGERYKKRRHCIAYVLHEDRQLGEPSENYYSIIERGYDDWGFDKDILTKALYDSTGKKALRKDNGKDDPVDEELVEWLIRNPKAVKELKKMMKEQK